FNAYLNGSLVQTFFKQGQPTGTSELARQFLGSASFAFPAGVDQLEFIDWPPAIGIGDPAFTFAPLLTEQPDIPLPEPTHSPEPGTVLLLVGALSALGLHLYRRRLCNPVQS